MGTATILTIEDDAPIRRGIVDSLRYAGFSVLEAGDGARGRQLALVEDVELVLLDVVMPRDSGFEILRAIRTQRPTLPVIMLTARGTEQDKVDGLKLGADDYIVKPFSVRELLARVEAVLRRSPQRIALCENAELDIGKVDFARREFTNNNGVTVELTEKESEILRYLFQNANRVVGRDELLTGVWHISPKGLPTRTVDMHIARLREKLGDNPLDPQVLITVRGKGYKFAVSKT